MTQKLRQLSKIGMKDANLYGGKAASLGEMLQAGIPVPDGFGVPITIQQEFHDKPFSDDLNREIMSFFKSIGMKRVAVRSSAIAEDGSDASWAGQLESYLNVEIDGVERAIRECWHSIESEHAKDYARDKNVAEEDLLVGVAVQGMVDSEVAGVMFTVNPISGDTHEMMIEGLYGLGEMLVQGIVTPDRYIVAGDTFEVEGFNIEVKSKEMVYRDGKNVTQSIPLERGDRAVLREEQVANLARIGKKIERHYGVPMDVEWAFADGKFYIVQARPITTLK